MKRAKVAVVLGTRPEIIKMAPIIKECRRRRLDLRLIHSGQHYTHFMDKVFFKDLSLDKPDFNLKIGSGSHSEETAKILTRLEGYLRQNRPDVVLVEGDTNTVFAAALCASQLNIKVGHVEAGLRSFDRSMPEEINRILVDHLSDYLFAPTGISRANLLKENIGGSKIFITGNTIVDALYQNADRIDSSRILKKLRLKKESYLLMTLHRASNVDVKATFKSIIKGIGMIYREFGLPVIYPMHPRARKNFDRFGFNSEKGIRIVDPAGYIDFLKLQKDARLILTDSGGVQEEACVLRVPCVTIRPNTERPETLKVKSNVITGTQSKSILNGAKRMFRSKRNWPNPFGSGIAACKTLDIIEKGIWGRV